jgi:HEAT repeat protein
MLIDPSPDVRAAAALAVAQLGDLTLLDELTHLALHDDFAVAHAAAEAVLRLEPRRITDLARTTRASAILERADLLKIGAT